MNFTAVSLFSGAGGMDIGFQNAGYQIIASNELDHHACETYRINHPRATMIEGDIDLCMNQLSQYQDVDVVFGGPPCQGFSVAGRMDPNDPRSKLIFSFVNVIKALNPKGFVMENVKALGVLAKFEDIRNELIKRFTQLNYQVSMIILNAKDFGVPQTRERVFFIGTKKEYKQPTLLDFESYKKEAPNLRESILHLGRAGTENNSNICKAKITLASKPILRKSPYAGMLFNGQGRPLNPDGWSSTLPASMGGNRTPIIDEQHLYENSSAWVESYHKHLIDGGEPYNLKTAPSHLRRLTIDEAKILQTFPEGYEFIGSQSKIFSQIGNAVPCKLAQVVAVVLKGALADNKPSSQNFNRQQIADMA